MTSYRPSRIYVIGVYLKRLVRWRRLSWPYLTVDAFARLAEVYISPPRFFVKPPTDHEIRNAKVIFCPSDKLEEFLSTHKNSINPNVIISGNSDYEFHVTPENIPNSVQMLLLQNSFISDNKRIFTMPIGVENFRFGVNGNPRLFKYSHTPKSARGRVLFGPFGATHPIRALVKLEFRSIPSNWLYLHSRIKPRKYRKLIKYNFEYVVSLRGNGVDTHRLWETLYRGRKAIVKNDSWLMSLPFIHPYVRTVDEWCIQEVKDSLTSGAQDFNPRDIPQLWMPYWEKMIKSFIN